MGGFTLRFERVFMDCLNQEDSPMTRSELVYKKKSAMKLQPLLAYGATKGVRSFLVLYSMTLGSNKFTNTMPITSLCCYGSTTPSQLIGKERNTQALISNGTIQNALAASRWKITSGMSSTIMDTPCPRSPNFFPTRTVKSTMGTKPSLPPTMTPTPTYVQLASAKSKSLWDTSYNMQ